MTTAQLPDWVMPPPGGFTAEDLDRLTDLLPHTELIDGSLVFVSLQANFHTLMMDLLVNGLRRSASADLRVRREMSVILGRRQRPEPDVSVSARRPASMIAPAPARSGIFETSGSPVSCAGRR